jgi:hypothetical protein
MALAKILYQLRAIEDRIAEIYDFIGLGCALSKPEIADMFSELAGDERLHAKEVAHVQAIFSNNADEFDQHPPDEAVLDNFQATLERTASVFREQLNLLETKAILEKAAELERNLIERHRLLYISTHNLQLHKLLNMLMAFDLQHHERMVNTASALGFAIDSGHDPKNDNQKMEAT